MSVPESVLTRRTIPVFPLATVVLFPGADCPLHIFEPRYRQMAHAARAADGVIGMVTVRPEHVGEMAGDPPVFPIGCLGRIVQSQELEDGRLNIVLHGEGRFRISDEPARGSEQLYRTAVIETLVEVAPDATEILERRRRAAAAFGRLVERVAPERADDLGPGRLDDLDDAAFVSVLVQMLNLPPVERQTLLETNGVGARLGAMESILQFQLARLGLGDVGGAGRLH